MVKIPAWVNDIFLTFLCNYENFWADTMEDERAKLFKKNLWATTLAEFDAHIIKQAILAAVIKHPLYPPKVGEFYAICRELKDIEMAPKPQLSEHVLLHRDMKKGKMPEEFAEKIRKRKWV